MTRPSTLTTDAWPIEGNAATAVPFVVTSITRHMHSRMEATHLRRRIAVFSGPPGIGKTTAIDTFRARFPRDVAVVKIARRNAKEVFVLQNALEALRQLSSPTSLQVPSSIWELRAYITRAVCQWAGIDVAAVRDGELPDFGRLTIIFDEAQNLSRDAIEVLRYWNDADRCYSPLPIGLIFVGNTEFSLADGKGGPSVISAAVADRAYHIQTFDYEDLSDTDLAAFMAAHGVTDREAITAIIRQLRTQRAVRSLRRLLDLIEDLRDEAGDRPVSAETVRALLQT